MNMQTNPSMKYTLFSMHPGPPGAGKSTSAALLAKHNGYVYYEGDCQLSCINPYLDPSIEEPSLAQSQQTPLKVHFSENSGQ